MRCCWKAWAKPFGVRRSPYPVRWAFRRAAICCSHHWRGCRPMRRWRCRWPSALAKFCWVCPACCTFTFPRAAAPSPCKIPAARFSKEISMRAIILAAGRGLRLQQPDDRQMPKCLLQFGGMSLLERHLRILRNAGIDEIVLALGYRHERVEFELNRLHWQPRPEIVLNPRFDLGSVLTVHTVAD